MTTTFKPHSGWLAKTPAQLRAARNELVKRGENMRVIDLETVAWIDVQLARFDKLAREG